MPPAPPSAEPNIWVADVQGQVTDIPGLQINGVRATRARYPNLAWGIEATCGYGCMVDSSAATWVRRPRGRPWWDRPEWPRGTQYVDTTAAHHRSNVQDLRPQKNQTIDWFSNYSIGVDASCAVYDPPVSYWCGSATQGGGAGGFATPGALAYKFPHGPYKNPEDALLFIWHPGRWANWMFEVDQYIPANDTFVLGKGGFQGARGHPFKGGDFFIENVMEELDYPGEFFFDKRVGKLYLFHNGTGAPLRTQRWSCRRNTCS